jgi:hypothetical protein
MDKLNSKKWKKSSFYEEKSLVGLTPNLLCETEKTTYMEIKVENQSQGQSYKFFSHLTFLLLSLAIL